MLALVVRVIFCISADVRIKVMQVSTVTCYRRLICAFLKTTLNHNQNQFSISLLLFLFVWRAGEQESLTGTSSLFACSFKSESVFLICQYKILTKYSASTKPGSDRTGPDHGSDRGSDHGSDHGSDQRKKKRFKEKNQIVYKIINKK